VDRIWEFDFGSGGTGVTTGPAVSEDGGRHWRLLKLRRFPRIVERGERGSFVQLSSVIALTRRTLVAIFEYGPNFETRQLARSDDAGRTWRVLHRWNPN
jgi:hypothetical protein